MNKFFIGLFVAAFVCGVLFLCGATAEAGVVNCVTVPATPLIANPLWDIAMLVIVVISIFL